jgi:hypothetical protein
MPASSLRRKTPRKPFVRIYHTESLHAKTLAVLGTVEKAKDRTRHRGALADVIVELTAAGMDYCFLRPLALVQAGAFVEQSAGLGMAAAVRLLASVVRNIIGRMDDDQLLIVCRHMRQLME